MHIFLMIIQNISILLIGVEMIYVFLKWKNKTHGLLFINCLAILVNNLGYLLCLLSKNESEYIRSLQFSYLGRVWIGFTLFLFIMDVCKIHVRKPFIIGGTIFYSLIYAFVLTCDRNNLYYKTYEFKQGEMFPYLKITGGIFHVIYFISIFVLIIVGLSILFYKHFIERNEIQRKRLFILCIAMIIDSVFFIVEILGFSKDYDITSFGYALSSLVMYYAILRYSLLDTLQFARDYVIDELAEGIVVVNNKNIITYYNKPALKILPELKFAPSSALDLLNKYIKLNKPIEIDEKIYFPEITPLVQEGTLEGNIYSLIDDTEHFIYMKQLKEQKDIAEAANASKSRFVSVVSHELRTPMNAVSGMTDLLLADKHSLTAKQEQYLKNIKSSSSSLVMIVNDILDQSKIEAGKMEIITSSYKLKPLLDDIKMIIENRIGSKPIKVEMTIEEGIPPYLIGDSLRIRQIIINLMNNSVKFTEKGKVSLTISKEKQEGNKLLLKYSICDTGQGIKKEDLKKLGEAFAQVDTKKNHEKEGTGLGLSISKDFIRLMGGQLQISSEYGKGSEFYFSIYQEISNEVDKQDDEEIDDFICPDAKVLVVDDTEINLMICEEIFAQIGVKAQTINSGDKALELVKKNKYDIIFMDYMMPGKDGVETTKAIRDLCFEEENEERKEYYKTVPIVALSGDTSDETNKKFVDAGVNDFTEKPVELKNLKRLLKEWIDESLIIPNKKA